MSDFSDVLRSRTASQGFDSKYVVPDGVLRSILDDSLHAPSSFDLQHWRFLAITDHELTSRLLLSTLPSNRQRLVEAPVSILILGDMQAHLGLKDILEKCVLAGTLSREIADEWLPFALKAYTDAPQLAREEAIRSCSLAAMTLMLSAADKGLATCPVGFNAPELVKTLNLSDRYVPIIWIALGKAAPLGHRRRPRHNLDEILSYNVAPSS